MNLDRAVGTAFPRSRVDSPDDLRVGDPTSRWMGRLYIVQRKHRFYVVADNGHDPHRPRATSVAPRQAQISIAEEIQRRLDLRRPRSALSTPSVRHTHASLLVAAGVRTRAELTPRLAELRIYWMTIPELIGDVYTWYLSHPRRAALRRTLTGDLLHLLFGLSGLVPVDATSEVDTP